MKNKVFQSIWFCWALLTAVYLILNIMGYPNNASVGEPMGYIAGAIGLFVPFGILSILYLLEPETWLSVPVFAFLMLYAEKKLKEKNYGFIKNLLINLLVLLIITIIVDFARMTPFESWRIFIDGGTNISL